MKQCPGCNANIKDDSKFCHKCGCNIKKYEEEDNKQNKIYCQECGKELEKGTIFCTECGSKVSSFEQVQNSDIFNDDFLSSIDASISKQKEEKEIDELFSQFEYEKHMDGTYTIVGLKDKNAFNYNIPEKVVSIGSYAFANCKVNKIDLPEGLIEIAEGAFKDCIYLEKINLPKSLRFIREEAFLNCSLLEIEIPNNIIIGKDAIKNTLTDKKRNEKEEAARKIKEAQERKEKEEAARKAEAERIKREKEEAARKEEAERLKKIEERIGTFGSYFIDNSKYKQPIEWIILEKKGNNLLLISKYGIDCKQYNNNYKNVTWETCDLRKWLNKNFINSAFNKAEQNKILNTRVHTNDNSEYGTNGGNDTIDKIFLLSIEEVKKYFASDEDRICYETNYVKEKEKVDPIIINISSSCWWWLRSPGCIQGSAATVDFDGDVEYDGLNVNYDTSCVRPALWINIE